MAIQKGHSDEIIQLEFSGNNTYLASLAKNNEFIIWDVNLEKSVSSFRIGEIEQIEGFKFTKDENKLKIKTFRTTYFYDIQKTKLIENSSIKDTIYRQKTLFIDTEKKYKLDIHKGSIRKRGFGKRFNRYKKSVNYANSPFLAFDVDISNNQLIGVAKNEVIFIYNYTLGVKYWELKGHNSKINDIRFSNDGKYFATAGMDRSIIIWNAKKLKLEKRLYSNIYQKKTATFSHDGQKIFVGDELGQIFEINLAGAFPSIRVSQPNYHAVNKIVTSQIDSIQDYYIVSENNHVYQKQNVLDKKSLHKYVLKNNSILNVKNIFLQDLLKTYQPPVGQTKLLDFSEDNKMIAYTGNCKEPNIAVATIGKRNIKHLFLQNDNRQWLDIDFVSDNEIIAIFDSSNVIYQWKIEGKKTYLKTDTLPLMIKNFEYIGHDEIWLNSNFYGQFIYNLKTRKLTEKLKQSVENIFRINQYIVLATSSNSIIFYDLNKNETYFSFMGHKGLVTDVNMSPNNDFIISSSDDGSVKLWSLEQKKLLVTIFPFKNNEFIFINTENYYLITKGAMAEIGFKYDGQFFFPEQFDLKFNRPDIILNQLGYNDQDLISAYKKAYLKRLKKMNFTEEQLKSDYDLPTVNITNLNDLPNKTTEKSITLNLDLFDKKHNLNRINIWINDVAIYGINGVDISQLNTTSLLKDVSIELASGSNKIQVSVLNESGAESFKKTIEVESTLIPSRPNLYVVTLGVSKHKNQNFDLVYADKDARDVAETFKNSTYFKNVNTLTLTNEEVTLSQFDKIKSFIEQAGINDIVVVFVAGHGVLDADFNYYFASYDMNFENPSINGIPYEKIEQLLDGIKALKKLLFIDTCHSGELDKDEVEEVNEDNNDTEQGDIIFRSVGTAVQFKDNPLGLKSTNELMKSLFTDLRKGTGATVISSSGGTELSIEGGLYQNGLFTYCLINGLTNKKADLDKNKIITVSEIQKYISSEVNRLSHGKQTPTSRIENTELDYRMW